MMSLLGPDDSAITKMMGLLSPAPPVQQTPGGPAGPGAGTMSALLSNNVPAAPGPIPTTAPSMADRIHDRMSGLLGSIADHTRPSAPAGFEGLLSPEEIQSARPSFLSSFAGDAAQHAGGAAGAYEDRLKNIVLMHGLASQTAEHRRVLQARAAMPTLFPEKPGETMAETRQRLGSMYAYLMSHGDEEGMKEVGSTLRGIMTAPHAPNTIQHVPGVGLVDLSKIGPDGKPTVVMESSKEPSTIPGTPEWKAAEAYKASLVPHPEPLVQVEGKDGPIWVPRNEAAGMPVKKSGMAGSAQNMASEALLRSSASEMANADTFMRKYEEGLANKTVSINGLSQFLGGLGNAFTHDDPASRAIQNTALATLNSVNPELARYIRRGLSFAEGEAGISKRPSDFRTKMATFLSTAASGASPEMIADIQGRRHSILAPIQQVIAGSSKGSGSATGAGLSYEDWKKSKGHK